MFMEWIHSQRKFSLHDISLWDLAGIWKGWKLGNFPEVLKNQVDQLLSSLQGISPHHLDDSDSRGWGIKGYSFSKGYESLMM
jgi:hypothetical protein